MLATVQATAAIFAAAGGTVSLTLFAIISTTTSKG